MERSQREGKRQGAICICRRIEIEMEKMHVWCVEICEKMASRYECIVGERSEREDRKTTKENSRVTESLVCCLLWNSKILCSSIPTLIHTTMIYNSSHKLLLLLLLLQPPSPHQFQSSSSAIKRVHWLLSLAQIVHHLQHIAPNMATSPSALNQHCSWNSLPVMIKDYWQWPYFSH